MHHCSKHTLFFRMATLKNFLLIYKATMKYYDDDGDLDIAAISFFADYKNHPEEGFIYLENNGNFDFHPYGPIETRSGRWLTMDAGDIDCDGRIDLVLGNFLIGNSPGLVHTAQTTPPPFLVLRNTGKNH